GTVPLLQVWTCVALGRWDDSAMNWPWLAILAALVAAVYGALRGEGVAPLLALLGAYLLASLPLVEVHVALAGYADLPMGAVYALAAIAFYRWAIRRDARDAVIALLLALACPLIKTPGWIWAATLIPGVIIALSPRRGARIIGTSFALAALALLVLARTEPTVLGYRLHLDFAPAWAFADDRIARGADVAGNRGGLTLRHGHRNGLAIEILERFERRRIVEQHAVALADARRHCFSPRPVLAEPRGDLHVVVDVRG